MPENKEPYGNTDRETNSKWGIREAIDTSNSWLHH